MISTLENASLSSYQAPMKEDAFVDPQNVMVVLLNKHFGLHTSQFWCFSPLLFNPPHVTVLSQ